MTTEMTTRKDKVVDQPAVKVFKPQTDIFESDDTVFITMEMPGVGTDDIDISLEKQVLSVRGRAQQSQSEAFELTHAEYLEGDFERVFSLGEDFDAGKIKAEMKNGLLILTLPRAEAAKPKRIHVKKA